MHANPKSKVPAQQSMASHGAWPHIGTRAFACGALLGHTLEHLVSRSLGTCFLKTLQLWQSVIDYFTGVATGQGWDACASGTTAVFAAC